LSLRIEQDLLRKFDYVAKYDDRSMNWLLLSLVRKCIGDFEETHVKSDSRTGSVQGCVALYEPNRDISQISI
jgi:hypothetical protein